jgi:hypothetical protein
VKVGELVFPELLVYLFIIYLPPTERISPIKDGIFKVIQNTHYVSNEVKYS